MKPQAFPRLTLMVLALVLCPAAQALPNADLRQFLNDIQERHPALAAQDARYASATAQVDTRGAWPNPQISWGTAPRTWGNEDLGRRQIWQLSQTIPWPGTLALREDQQRLRSEAQKERLGSLRLDLQDAGWQAYLDWQLEETRRRSLQDNLRLLDDLQAVARQRYASGQGGQYEWLAVKLRRSRLEARLIETEARLQALQAQSNALRDRPSSTSLPFQSGLEAPPALPSLASLDAAGQDHPLLQALRKAAEAGEYGLALARREDAPDLKWQTSYLGTLDPEEKRWQIGLSLELPLNRRQSRAQRAVASAELEQARAELNRGLNEWRARLAQNYSNAQKADQRDALLEEQSQRWADAQWEAALSAWQSGKGDFQSLIDAQEQKLNLRIDRAMARSAQWRHRSQLNVLSAGQLSAALFGAEAP